MCRKTDVRVEEPEFGIVKVSRIASSTAIGHGYDNILQYYLVYPWVRNHELDTGTRDPRTGTG
eukprot:964840-Prorocentrum_minimum.AAC.1